MTLGIQPSRPDSGFGYIEYQGDEAVKDVLAFKEKPDVETAKTMIAKSKHAWNGGMFILQSNTWINAIAQSNKEIFFSIKKAWQLPKPSKNAENLNNSANAHPKNASDPGK